MNWSSPLRTIAFLAFICNGGSSCVNSLLIAKSFAFVCSSKGLSNIGNLSKVGKFIFRLSTKGWVTRLIPLLGYSFFQQVKQGPSNLLKSSMKRPLYLAMPKNELSPSWIKGHFHFWIVLTLFYHLSPHDLRTPSLVEQNH